MERMVRMPKRFALLVIVCSTLGCWSEIHRERNHVPMNASFILESDSKIAYAVHDDGKLFLWDQTSKKLVSGFYLSKGETFSFDPSTGHTEVNGAKSNFNVTPGHKYRLYFQRKFEM
jgi:hypothetical protein